MVRIETQEPIPRAETEVVLTLFEKTHFLVYFFSEFFLLEYYIGGFLCYDLPNEIGGISKNFLIWLLYECNPYGPFAGFFGA